MRIAFLTTCLEPARDGVGDYTTGLAEECAGMGHSVFRMSLNDPFAGSKDTDCVRLHASMPWPDRIETARKALAAFSPDWISLQFVCYGFHPRGIDWSLEHHLNAIVGEIPLQVMFHELWIGSERGAPLKDRVIGALQRVCVKRVLRRLRPRMVHTTNPSYTAQLTENGINPHRLPLFGSIPVDPTEAVKSRERSGTDWRFGIFGTLHPVWPPQPLINRLIATGRNLTISHVGNIGQGESLWENMRQEFGGRIRFEKLGALSPRGVAEFFAKIDFGIATTPWEIIGKSASVAAMLEHGLPVVVNRDDVHYRGWKEEGYSPLLIKMGDDLATRLERASKALPQSNRKQVALQFLEDWEGAR